MHKVAYNANKGVIMKVGDKVKLIQTAYLNNQYEHHGNVSGTIVGLVDQVDQVDQVDWRNGNVPEYEVKVRRKVYTVPEYSFEKWS